MARTARRGKGSTTQSPRRTGRPTLYRPEYCEEVVKHCAEGLSFEAFAGRVSVSIETIYEWARRYPEFAEAKKRGAAASRIWWENAGKIGMLAPGFNAAVWIFNMKNRFGWRDKQPDEREDDADLVARKVAERIRVLTA